MTRHLKRGFRLSILGLLIAAVAQANGIGVGIQPGDSVQAYLICTDKYGQPACLAYARRSGAAIYSEPHVQSRILERSEYGAIILLLEPAQSVNKKEWIRTSVLILYEENGEKKSNKYFGYVQRSDVVLYSDFRRIVGCWPLTALSWAIEGSGEYEGEKYELHFDVKGNVDKVKMYDRESHKDYAIYYAGGIFLIHDNSALEQLAPTFVLDYPKRSVTNSYPNSLKEQKGNPPFLFAKDEALKGCTQIPKVDPSQPLYPKPTPKRN